MQHYSREQGEQFRAQVETAITSWRKAMIAAERAAERLDQAGQRMEVSHYLLALLTGITTGQLVSVF
ncbi:hypothetical protein [Duganella violaceipulchra]|uniref:Uncharacterized protein n=1 Tax=Duganella violaceipulchra TaxID=2849652 RepID=A0AA41L4C9_9BURK|nr:hypothetical protein [Duganella violaceicalia]MBV6325138.1 hypothetical protein [Duganella violaceicalia]MCP2011564.1 hypothetical protein [Duganella violaceicalia]